MRLLLLLTLALCPSVAHASPDDEVLKLLNSQVTAWNKHDLDGFMNGYWKSNELTFYSGGTVTRGWQATLDRYRQKYQSPGNEMGRLSFDGIEMVDLAATAVMARGRWRVSFSDGKISEGLFTLMLRKLPEGWRIVHDHTSIK